MPHIEWAHAETTPRLVAPGDPDGFISAQLDPDQYALTCAEIAVYGTREQLNDWLTRALHALDPDGYAEPHDHGCECGNRECDVAGAGHGPAEPSEWFAEGYSVGRYDTKMPAEPPAQYERVEFFAGFDAGRAAAGLPPVTRRAPTTPTPYPFPPVTIRKA